MTRGGRKLVKKLALVSLHLEDTNGLLTSGFVFLMCLFYVSFIDQKKEVYKTCLTLDFQSPTKLLKSGVYFSNVY